MLHMGIHCCSLYAPFFSFMYTHAHANINKWFHCYSIEGLTELPAVAREIQAIWTTFWSVKKSLWYYNDRCSNESLIVILISLLLYHRRNRFWWQVKVWSYLNYHSQQLMLKQLPWIWATSYVSVKTVVSSEHQRTVQKPVNWMVFVPATETMATVLTNWMLHEQFIVDICKIHLIKIFGYDL